ncbi:hormone-sensitive lipase [Tribolium castaneum]|uniref:Hormone-sensitive lipase-like Protein n=1 Tax=Tribolium castaneum TaxID=7070 RepID=D2A0J0_TRICA|nr:PREDICTED: hormone-sensitive lipase [Tribolium castaneum]EFA02512.1 Hormone-sensitive lipase-like Protein [Tribolium castaneum]|eukprot:XP_975636.1 PREDICTED: hormone-sensitive lipase [Tribolium castaneum]
MTDQDNAVNGLEPKEASASNIEVLKDLCENNANFFAKDTSENGQRLYISFMGIRENLDEISQKMARIASEAPRFDFDESTPGNGYRSFLSVANSAIDYGIALNKKICLKRASAFFRKSQLTKDVESCAHLIASLDTCFKHLETLISWSSAGNLFPDEEHSPQELLSNYEDINQYCFYGRCMGFQFCESLRNILQFISMSMAIFSEIYYNQGSFFAKATTSLMATSKYVNDPEQRARRIVNISQNADVNFCKAFWFLSENELMTNMPYVVAPSVAVSRIISLPPEPFTLEVDGREIDVPVPSSHIGRKPVQVRLISHEVHEGMIGEASNKYKSKPPARGLIIHCHGGGFVAQSSLSHECYLREWAKQLKVPILSIDYSLAPEAPFPRALEEVTYAYCWALKNCQLLGSTGERIIGAGDSAGANLLLSTTLKCLNLGIPPPMGLFVAYVPTLVNFVPSPSRLLCMMDPLLPFGFMMRCLKAYACPDNKKVENCDQTSDTESFEEISESDLMELQAHKSPVSETSDTLTYGSLNSGEDDRNKDIDLQSSNIENSQKYVSDFLEKYVLDSDTETDGTRVPVLKHESATSSQSIDDSLQTKVSSFVSNLKWRFNSWIAQKAQVGVDFMVPRSASAAEKYLDLDRQGNLLDEFKFTVPEDPFLSPFCAKDEDLERFPPVRVLTVHLDPCLDDCVMFSKRLKQLNKNVHLDILSGLPHGFLNFSLISKEAYEGSKLCVKRINELLNLDNLPPLQ